MRVLLIKTSSLGDIIHTFPAISDAVAFNPDIKFDWVVEDSFKDLPVLHKAVDKVITINLRKWRKNIFNSLKSGEITKAVRAIRTRKYDLVIDAQGLLKSAIFTKFAKGPKHGLSFKSAREPLAASFYHHKYKIPKDKHAVSRTRNLFANIFGYEIDYNNVDYAIKHNDFVATKDYGDYILFFHGTTWETKYYPEHSWLNLIKLSSNLKQKILLPWGNEQERERANKLAKDFNHAEVLPRLNLFEIASIIKKAKACVAVDTGLGHFACALEVPTISIYGATNSRKTGTWGKNQIHIDADYSCAPCLRKTCDKLDNFDTPSCYQSITPEKVYGYLKEILV